MKMHINTAKNTNHSFLKSTLQNLKNSFNMGEFTRKDIEKLATRAIISTDKLLHGSEYSKHRLINTNDLCILMNDMGMISDIEKVKKGGSEPSGGAGSQAIEYGSWTADNILYPVEVEQAFYPHHAI